MEDLITTGWLGEKVVFDGVSACGSDDGPALYVEIVQNDVLTNAILREAADLRTLRDMLTVMLSEPEADSAEESTLEIPDHATCLEDCWGDYWYLCENGRWYNGDDRNDAEDNFKYGNRGVTLSQLVDDFETMLDCSDGDNFYRVFVDDESDLWFEVAPNRFSVSWYATDSYESVRRVYREKGPSGTSTLESLRDSFSHGHLLRRLDSQDG